MKNWLLYPFLLASSGLLIFVVRCVLGLLAKHPPKMRAMRSVPVKCLGVLMLLATAIGMLAVPKNPPLGGGVLDAPLRLMQRLAGDPPESRLFTADELDARFVLQSVDTNSEWSATKPTGAVEPTVWSLTGAFRDKYENLAVGGWEFPYLGAFPFGTNEVTRMAFLAQGEVRPDLRDESTHISPLAGVTSIPRGDRLATAGANFQSRFWTLHTPTNALYTWENSLFLDRTMPTYPVSFQIEMFPNGNFTLRHDISSLDDTAWQAFTNSVRTGAQWHGHGEMVDLSLLPKYSKAEFRYHALDERDLTDPDRDGDGITTADEIFIYHTDPGNPDTDYDGLSDLDEIFGYHTDPLNPNSLSQLYSDGFAVKLGDLDPFSYPPNSTNTVLEHIFYSGTTNGAFAYPQSTEDVAVLKISVSGTGTGSLVVGDSVVPLVAPPQMRSGAVTNTLLLAVEKGLRKEIWLRKAEGLELALDSDDFMIGDEIPSPPFAPRGWIAFPHTEATLPCIHDLSDCRRTVRLVHGEEFPGLTATWESSAQGVTITNNPPVSAEVRARIPKNENRSITYTVAHPKWLRGYTTFEQSLRFCPPMTHGEEVAAAGSEDGFDEGKTPDLDDSVYSSAMGCACGEGGCACCNGGWCVCRDINCMCNLDRVSELTLDETEAAEAYTNIVVSGLLTHIGDVLYLHKENKDIVHLDVPGGDREPCCPCPEHQNTNYVSKAACSRRLAVKWPSGENFSISHVTCNVDVIGTDPSFDFRDSRVLFVRDGAAYKSGSYTVLGVDIDTEQWLWPSFNDYETLSSGLGFPMTVCTNLVEAPGFVMQTDVFLSNGVVRVALENVEGEFKVWLAEWRDFSGTQYVNPPELLLSSDGTTERHMPIERWRSIMRRYGGVRSANILVTSSQAGHCDLVLEFACAKGSEYVHDVVSRRITSVNPPLLTDTDRDGAIGEGDVLAYIGGRAFRYWTNEDTAKGDYAGQNSSTAPNASDLVVNGRLDLVNFFPAKLDLKPFVDAWGNSATFVLWAPEGRLRFCGVDMNADSAWEHQTNDVYTTTGDHISVTSLTPIVGEGAEINPADYLGNENEPGMLAFEAADEILAHNSPELLVIVNDVAMYRFRLPMSIMSVRDMYGWINIRRFSDGSEARPTILNKTWNDDSVKSLLFLHGANVSEADAEIWGDVLFKRLWLSGAHVNFYNVDWRSNIGSPLNYQQNASNAFVVASRLYTEITNSVSGEKVVMAHSLGNMVVSSMIQDYGLEVSNYLMCNSAVPAEAYDADMSLRVPQLVHSDWEEYPTNSWAASWHWLFRNEFGDDRKLLGWPGRFSDVTQNAVNFYSTGDEVLEIATNNCLNIDTDVWGTNTFGHLSWHKQELFKGRGLGVGGGGTTWSGWNIEENVLGVEKISVSDAQGMNDDDFKTNTVFYCYPSSMNSTNIPLLVRGAHLALGIPALTPATGWCGIANVLYVGCSINLDDTGGTSGVPRPNGWPVLTDYPDRWRHSDMKDVAYFFNFKFYYKVIERGGLQ